MNHIIDQVLNDPLVLLVSGAILGYIYSHFIE